MIEYSYMEDSVFTKIVKGELPSYKVYEDDRFIAILDINPINPGHTLVVPKKQVDYLFDLSSDLYHDLFDIVKKLSDPIKSATNAKRIGLAVEGFAVPHVHVHLVPIYKGNELNPELAHQISEEEMKQVQENILAKMN